MGFLSATKELKKSLENAKHLKYELLKPFIAGEEAKHFPHFRAKIPGGWIVFVNESSFFIPDNQHVWDGGSID